MSEEPITSPDSNAAAIRSTSSQSPLPHPEGHDEWLLDEALTETFPASDSIAVSHVAPPPKRPAE